MDDKNPLKMKVSELKAELGRRGLSQTGLKFDLAQRLQTAMDVDEFGALPSMTSPSHISSSPLLPVPENDSADHSDSTPQCPQTPSCEPVQGGASDEQAQDLGMAAEINGSEAAPPIEQCLADTSIVADATPTEGGAPPGTEDSSLASSEELGCGEKGRDQSKANRDGPDVNIHNGIGVDESKLVVHGGGSVEHEAADAGGSNEKAIGADKCGATATANEEPPLLSLGSPRNETDSSGTEECVQSGDTTSPILSGSVKLATAPASPPKGAEQAALGDKDQPPAVGEVEELDGKAAQGEEAKDDDPDEEKTGAKGGDTTDGDDAAGQRNQEITAEKPSGFAPDSLLLSASLAERMKGREARFRRENDPDNDNDKSDNTESKDKTGNHSAGPTEASGHGHGDKTDRVCGGSGTGQVRLPSAGDASQQIHGVQTVEGVRRAKLMKRKERFLAPPSSSSGNGLSLKSGNGSSAKLGAALAGCSSAKVPSGVVVGEETSGRTSSRRLAASEVAAKMARRSERFGVKGAGSSVNREVTRAELRDPRGSFFAESEVGASGGNTEQSQPLPSGGYSFDPLPQRQKRARATTTPVSSPSCDDDGTPAKRRGVGMGAAGAPEKAASPDVEEASDNNDEAAKTAELRIAMRFQPAGSNGVGDENPPQREETKKPSPPSSSSGKRASLGSAFVLLGVKKPKPAGPEPRLSTKTATAAGKGKKWSIPPPPRLSSGGGGEADGASDHPPPERLGKEGKARGKQTRQHQDGLVEKKLAEQAAKMAERRKRFAEDPRAPSFR